MGSKIGGYPQTGDLQNSNFLTLKLVKVLENCNQVKVSLLTKKLLEVKYKVLAKKST